MAIALVWFGELNCLHIFWIGDKIIRPSVIMDALKQNRSVFILMISLYMVIYTQATYAGLEAAVRDLKSAYDLCQAAIIPSPRDGSVAKDLPRYYELNEAALEEWLPGTLLLTTTGELRFSARREAR